MESSDNSRDGLLFSKINFPDLLMACALTKPPKSNRNSIHNESTSQLSNEMTLNKPNSTSSSTCLSSSSNSSLSSNNNNQKNHLNYSNINENTGFNKRQNFNNNNNNNNNSGNNNNRNRKNSSNQPFIQNNNNNNNNNQRSMNNNNNNNIKCNYNNYNNRNYHNSASSSSIPSANYYSNLQDKDMIKRNNNNNYFKSNLDESKNFKNENNKDKKQKEMNNTNSNSSNRAHFNNNNNNNFNQQFQFQQAPFQPPAYHHYHNNHHHHNNNKNNNNNNNKHKFLIEKYHHKFNLISFILLRKNDEYLNDYKYYFNDQSYYQQVDYFIETRQIDKLNDLFLNNKICNELDPIKTLLEIETSNTMPAFKRLTNFTNSYNCNLFVYTVRKCLENESKLLNQNDENNNGDQSKSINDSLFLKSVVEMLFSKECRPDAFHLIDGDYPKRNIMHYASQYNCTLIPKLILNSEEIAIEEEKNEEIEINESKKEENDQEKKETTDEEDTNSKLNKNELVFIQLCMQTDFNGNTPAHLAAINNSIDLLKLIHPLCIKYSQLIYNDDGLNPFLLACRHSSIEFIQYLVESSFSNLNTVDEIENKASLDLLSCRDKINSKNCLHFACGRGCGNDALNTVKYLTNLTQKKENDSKLSLNELLGAISPLVGSIFHVAASNLTRLSTLWYLLESYSLDGLCNLNSNSNHFAETILNRLDFREFTCVDCLFDSVMNLREMAPPNCKSLSSFFNDLLTQQIDSSQTAATPSSKSINFKILLNSCIYKLLIDFRANIYNLPRVRNQWQLLEFFRLLVFMSKFGSNNNQRFTINASNFNTVYFQNFEAFCLNFLNKFIICGDLLPLVTNTEKLIDNEKKQTKQTNNDELYYILNEILLSFYELTSICLLSGPLRYTSEFKAKIYAFFSSFLTNLETFSQVNNVEPLKTKLNEIKHKCNQELNEKKQPFSLKNLCRIKINDYLFDSNSSKAASRDLCSALSENYLLQSLPKKYSELTNFLSFNLIDDLYN